MIFPIILFICLLMVGILAVKHDKDFNFVWRKREYAFFVFFFFTSIPWLTDNFWKNVYIVFALSYLIISAFTDMKTKTVYVFPLIGLIILSTITESVINKQISIFVLIILIFATVIYLLKLYGFGDVLMVFVPGSIIRNMEY